MDTIPEIIQAYQDLVQSQQSTYEQLLQSQQSSNNHLIIGLGIIFTLLISLIAYINYFRTKGQIQEQTKEIFADEREKIMSQLKEEFQNDFANLKSEYENKFIELEADIRYIHIPQLEVTEGKDFVQRIHLEAEGINKCIIGRIPGGTRNFVDYILQDLELLNKNPKYMMDYIEETKKIVEEQLKTEYSIGHIKEIILKIPGELNMEKNQILEFLKKIEEKQNR